ncbi:hypothetical protein [Larkinella soli]|uniref:hypothetical protein n=1 Tax=Larkinella soli TaxID=1770527 RepID=UPI000FFB7149|nr:hypothetical protein [Larkinella soli]
MKMILSRLFMPLLVVMMVSVTSCKKDGDIGPGGFVPDNMVGQWLHGNFSMTEFWGYDGSYQGNAYEQSVAFDFKGNGRYEMYFIGTANNYGCRTEALSWTKGKVDFNEEEGTFTLTPSEGRFRGYYNCASGQNFDRKARPEELKTQVFRYEFKPDSYGKVWLFINDSSFKAVSW